MACLSTTITAEIDRLLTEVDMVREYRAYRWKADSWMNGFPKICNLERSLSSAARENRLGYFHARTWRPGAGFQIPSVSGARSPSTWRSIPAENPPPGSGATPTM